MTVNRILGAICHALLTLGALTLLGWLFWAAWPGRIEAERVNVPLALAHLRGLQLALHHKGAAAKMQEIFPEGACFTVSLYGWSQANLAPLLEGAERQEAVAEIRCALEQQQAPGVLAPFGNTQVRNGVFWLGQRNYLLGKYLGLLTQGERPLELVEEFHTNSAQMAQAFLASPTHHLDSYTGMCWPADNVTALTSLVLHDHLYGTSYRIAYEAWKEWTVGHPDPTTKMPTGHLRMKSGKHLGPARGCANSLMIPMLSEIDPVYARQLYQDYQRWFGVVRFGLRMFREWPQGQSGHGADIDSGPIIWGAGVTATGVGLAAARSQGDIATEADIRDLAAALGFPHTTQMNGRPAITYLFGVLPVGDAFLAWALSLPRPQTPDVTNTSTAQRLRDRKPCLLTLAVLSLVVLAQGIHHGRKALSTPADDRGLTRRVIPRECSWWPR